MGRYTGASCKLCRREATKLMLKGERCISSKCAFERRGYPPGQHGQRMSRKTSSYGIQLREKQKTRRMYGLIERQFRNTFKKAARMDGVTGDNFLTLLECRLDNVVYKLGFAPSRKTARQLIRHGHFLLNGKKVNIPSIILGVEDTVQLKGKSKSLDVIHNSLGRIGDKERPSWLSLDKVNMNGVVNKIPEREDIITPVDEHLIVELYSR